jgi:hypothetical protein
MFKHLVHLIFFAAGAGVGIWWGVNHPTQAQDLAAQEQAKVQQAIDAANTKIAQLEGQSGTTPPAAGAPSPLAQDANAKATKLKSIFDQLTNDVKSATAKPAN